MIALFFCDVPDGSAALDATQRVEDAIRTHIDGGDSRFGAAVRLRWIGEDRWQIVWAKPIGQSAPPGLGSDSSEDDSAQRIAQVLRGEGIAVVH